MLSICTAHKLIDFANVQHFWEIHLVFVKKALKKKKSFEKSERYNSNHVAISYIDNSYAFWKSCLTKGIALDSEMSVI